MQKTFSFAKAAVVAVVGYLLPYSAHSPTTPFVFNFPFVGSRWLPDELGNVSFARLQELTVLPVTDYDGRFDKWTIDVPLSEGCLGPALPEEIML